jgi:diguanylate cyclase (GGDEF)-like protein
VSFRRYENINLDKHVLMAEGVTRLMAERLETDMIDYYLENNYSSEEYRNLISFYDILRDSYPDVRHMYVYRISKDENSGSILGETIVKIEKDITGEVSELGEETIGDIVIAPSVFSDDFERMTIKNECVWHIVESDGASIVTYVRPVLDEDGNYVCSACVDFSLNAMYAKGVDFIIELLVVVNAVIIGVLVTINLILSAILFKPLNRMTKCIEAFKFDSDEDRFNNVNSMEELNIHVHNEIDELYNALVMSLKDSAYYMSNFNRAKTEINKISETAYKDPLTRVGSKVAYDDAVSKLQAEMASNPELQFAIVMIDINNLKYVNDTYGHERGDEYIKGCSNIVCNIYKKSSVYRIGGDEFVVILRNVDYFGRNMLIDDLEYEFEKAYENKSVSEYCRYSASFGMSDYNRTYDKSVEEVFKRADKYMYEYKQEFKKANGSYR